MRRILERRIAALEAIQSPRGARKVIVCSDGCEKSDVDPLEIDDNTVVIRIEYQDVPILHEGDHEQRPAGFGTEIEADK